MNNNLYSYAISKFLLTGGFKDLKEVDPNKYSSNSSEGCILEVDHQHLKESRELHNRHPLAPDKMEIKKRDVANNQLKIADLYDIPIEKCLHEKRCTN